MQQQLPLLLTFSLLVAITLAADHLPHKRSSKGIKETVFNYEEVVPVINIGNEREPYLKVMHITVTSETYNFTLFLQKNEQLLPFHFSTVHYDKEGRKSTTKGHVNCFYHGSVVGHPDWKVTMSTCHGLRGEFGDFKSKENYFHLEPVDITNSSLVQVHALFLEYRTETGKCGTSNTHASVEDDFFVPKRLSAKNSQGHARVRRSHCEQWKIVELVILCDAEQGASFGTVDNTITRAINIANEMDRLYEPLCIRVALVEVEVWESNQFPVSVRAEIALDELKAYDYNRITVSHDATILLSGVQFLGDVVGKAFLRTMCRDLGAVAVIRDGGRGGVALVGGTAAHELGHLLNMEHDDACTGCTDPSGYCIMSGSAVIADPPTEWSTCSIEQLETGYTRYNIDACLSNTPTETFGGPVCGDGIIEGDEVCDCGGPDECIDPCCDARTCRLAAGAKCREGPCCNTSTCQYKSCDHECRSASGECDIAEYCTGESTQCPENRHKLDGTRCKNNNGFCFNGVCPTYDDQCRTAFTTSKADDICYSVANTRGDRYGNCGSTSTAYIRCPQSNAQCGQLQCSGGTYQFGTQPNARVRVSTLNIVNPSTGRPTSCRSFTTIIGASEESAGLVSDGTKCASGRACLSQECVPASQLTSMSCDRGTNGEVCSGNGVCSNEGECACNVGFTGSVCETEVVCKQVEAPDLPQVASYAGLVVVWTDENGASSSVTGYELLFYLPGTSQRATRVIDNSFTFHYGIGPTDKLNNPERTLVRVRRKTSSGPGEWSNGVSLGSSIPSECPSQTETTPSQPPPTTPSQPPDPPSTPSQPPPTTPSQPPPITPSQPPPTTPSQPPPTTPSQPPPTTPSPTTTPSTPPPTIPPTQPPTPPPSVWFEFRGQRILNNSRLSLGQIGEGDDALICKTNSDRCCGHPNRAGEFYYPDGTKVAIQARAQNQGFYRNRGSSLIRLNKRSGIPSPTGRYICVIPDASGTMQNVFINLF